MEGMTLLELITTTPVSEILAACAHLDEDNGPEPYGRVLEQLAKIAPVPSDFTILIEPWEDRDGPIQNISGLTEGTKYAIELTSWAEWLSSEVRIVNLDITPAQMIAQCLYEMTFFGFVQDKIQEKKDDLIAQIEEIRRDYEE